MPADLRLSDFLSQAAQGVGRAAGYAGQLSDKLYEAERVAEISKAQVELDRQIFDFTKSVEYDIFGNPNDPVDPDNPKPPRVVADLETYKNRGVEFISGMLSQIESTYKNPDAKKAIINYINTKSLTVQQHIEDKYTDYRRSNLLATYSETADISIATKVPEVAIAEIKGMARLMVETGVMDGPQAYQWRLEKDGKVYANVRGELVNDRSTFYELVAKGNLGALDALELYTNNVDAAVKMGAISEAEGNEKKTLFKAEAQVAGVIGDAYNFIMPVVDGKRKFVDNYQAGEDAIQNSGLSVDQKDVAMTRFQKMYTDLKNGDSKKKAEEDKKITDTVIKAKSAILQGYGNGTVGPEDLLVQVSSYADSVVEAQKGMNDPSRLQDELAFAVTFRDRLQASIKAQKAEIKQETDEALASRVEVEKGAFEARIAKASYNGTIGSGNDAELSAVQDELLEAIPTWGKYSSWAAALYGQAAAQREAITSGAKQMAVDADTALASGYDLEGSEIIGSILSDGADYDAALAKAQLLSGKISSDDTFKDKGIKAKALDRASTIIETIQQQKKVADTGAKALAEEEAVSIASDLGARAAEIATDKKALSELLVEARSKNWGKHIDKLWAIENRIKAYISDIDISAEKADFEADVKASEPLLARARQIQADFLDPTKDIGTLYADAQALAKDLGSITFKTQKVREGVADFVTQVGIMLKNETERSAEKIDRATAEATYEGFWNRIVEAGYLDESNPGDLTALKKIRAEIVSSKWGAGNRDLAGGAFSLVSQMIDIAEKGAEAGAVAKYSGRVRAIRAAVDDYDASGFSSSLREGFDHASASVASLRAEIEKDDTLNETQKQTLIDDLSMAQGKMGNILSSISAADAAIAKAEAAQANNIEKQAYNSLLAALASGGKIMDANLATYFEAKTVSTSTLQVWLAKSGLDPDMVRSEIVRLQNWNSDIISQGKAAIDGMFDRYKNKGITEAQKAVELLNFINAVNEPGHVFDMGVYLQGLEKRIQAGLPNQTTTTEVMGTEGGHLNPTGDDIVRQMYNGGFDFYSKVGEDQRAVMADALAKSVRAHLGIVTRADIAAFDAAVFKSKQAAEFTPLTVKGISGKQFFGIPVITYNGKTYTYIPENYDAKKGIFTGPSVLAVVTGSIAEKVPDKRSMSDLNAEETKINAQLAKYTGNWFGTALFPDASIAKLAGNKDLQNSLGLTKDITREKIAEAVYKLKFDLDAAKKEKKPTQDLEKKYTMVKSILMSSMNTKAGVNTLTWMDTFDTQVLSGAGLIKAIQDIQKSKSSR